MKRSPIHRRTPLAGGAPLTRGAPPARRTPLRSRSPRRQATAPAFADAAARVCAPGAECVLHAPVPLACFGGLTPHHLIKAGAGGSDHHSNLVPLCAMANDQIEDEPAMAQLLGLSIPRLPDAEAIAAVDEACVARAHWTAHGPTRLPEPPSWWTAAIRPERLAQAIAGLSRIGLIP